MTGTIVREAMAFRTLRGSADSTIHLYIGVVFVVLVRRLG